jgi:hypothetical protein
MQKPNHSASKIKKIKNLKFQLVACRVIDSEPQIGEGRLSFLISLGSFLIGEKRAGRMLGTPRDFKPKKNRARHAVPLPDFPLSSHPGHPSILTILILTVSL